MIVTHIIVLLLDSDSCVGELSLQLQSYIDKTDASLGYMPTLRVVFNTLIDEPCYCTLHKASSGKIVYIGAMAISLAR